MRRVFWAVFRRELAIAGRQRGALVHQLLFFVLIVALFPLGTNTDQTVLIAVAPAVLWMGVLLSVLLSLNGVFRADHEDGTLTQYLLAGEPLAVIALAKMIVHWLASAALLVVAGPVLMLMLGVSLDAWPAMILTLALGTPTLVFVGAIAAALTLRLPRAGLLLGLLVLPLYVPVLIFGAGVVRAAIVGLPYAGAVYIMAALCVLAITLGPWAIAAALRIGLDA
ncbi:MAG: heme exporter protein CcmB [Xanthomonadales bacterium]|nr:heme exporter protein CcmB [Xanthomonadales bacterium]|tara:strand:- start:1600 stop:2271 length:672 start_codon:yes stop_codon:yes gene_type:complete